MQATLLAPEQLSLPLVEAGLVQQTEAGGFRGHATLNYRNAPSARLIEWSFPVDKMPWVIEEALRRYRLDHDIYIAQHSYVSERRTTATLLSLNVAHIDLDLYKTEWASFTKQQILDALFRHFDRWQIDYPSYIVWSGRGMQLKWLWTEPLTPKAVARWQTALRWLCTEVLHDFGADIKAILPTQILRLVGSRNLLGEDVSILWVCGGDIHRPVKYKFDDWCNKVLPFTREQVREHRQRMAQYDDWRSDNKANLERLLTDQPSMARARALGESAKALGLTLKAVATIDDLQDGEIWTRRLGVMEQLLKLRGHDSVPKGDGIRHEWCWIAANAFGWINRKQQGPLKKDLGQWVQQNIPSYTTREAMQAASSVLRRANEPQGRDKGLYKLEEGTFKKRIGMSEAEAAQLKAQNTPISSPEQRWDIGSMQFEKMKGLTYEEYTAEVKRRRSEAADRTNELARAANAKPKEIARQLASEGLTQAEIGRRLGVDQSTAHRWLNC